MSLLGIEKKRNIGMEAGRDELYMRYREAKRGGEVKERKKSKHTQNRHNSKSKTKTNA